LKLAGADVNASSARGVTPLMLASQRGQLSLARSLQQLGARP
jgi:ankyrin repeat protein